MLGARLSFDRQAECPVEGNGGLHVPNDEVDLIEDSGSGHADDLAIPPTPTAAKSGRAVERRTGLSHWW